MSEEIQSKKEQPQPAGAAGWADATPAGLVALAVACICYFVMLTGIVEGQAVYITIACWLAGGFAVQFTVALIDLKNQNFSGGNTFLYFCSFFMLTGMISMFIRGGLLGGGDIALSSTVNGFAWLVLWLIIVLWTPAFSRSPGQLFLIILLLGVSIPFKILIDFGFFPAAARAFGIISGTGLLLCGILGIWLASATIVNKACGKNVYPSLKPFFRKSN